MIENVTNIKSETEKIEGIFEAGRFVMIWYACVLIYKKYFLT